MHSYKLILSYDGTRYRGWQKQGNTDSTIQGKLETVLTRILDEPIELAGSGRTDAGVHALGQVCSFHCENDTPPEDILAQLRLYLPEDIGALSLSPAPPRFHARLSCTKKTYVYRIWNSTEPNVFERRYMYTFPDTLDVEAMKKAADALLGEHDFRAFCSDKHMKKSTVRRLDAIALERVGNELRISFSANGFLYNMVRIITGTLLEVGTLRRSPEEIPDILASRDRSLAGFTAPAQGLCLVNCEYDRHDLII